MSRSLKNLILVLLILIISGTVIFTINYAKNSLDTSKDMNTNIGNVPGQNQDNNFKKEGENSNTENMTPPEKPDENNQNSSNDKKNSESGNSDLNENNNSENAKNDSNMMMPDIPNNSSMNVESNLSIIYYFLFGIESFGISLILAYLIMSKFNKRSFKEVFINKDKVLIYSLLTIVLSFILTFLVAVSANKYIDTTSKNKMGMENSQNNNSSSNITYSSPNEIDEDKDITSGDYSSSKSDENAILATGNITANLSNITVTKTGDSDGGDNTSFYGTNSAIIAKSGANLTLKNINVETNATGSNGVFSYGGTASTNNSSSDGTIVTISDSKIVTKKDNSGGIMTTGGGVMKAVNLTVTTSGVSSAAIRTDRGGGTVTVEKGVFTTTGQGSPSIYSTAKINVKDAKLISKSSEGIVIEGKNSVSIDNTTLIDTNNKLNGKSTTYKNIFMYQSMSGDASSGESYFKAVDSKITTNKGDTFYVTNTIAKIELSNNTFINNDDEANFLRIKKDSWGNDGSNGGDVELIMTNQKIEGNIVVDSISNLDMSLSNKSVYKGTINTDDSAKEINLKLDKSSKITLTGNSYVTSLEDADATYSNIDFNGYKLYVNGKAIN